MKSVTKSASRYAVFFLLYVMIIGFQPIRVFADTVWLTGWGYRKSNEIAGSASGAQTDYQILFEVRYGAGADLGNTVYLNSKCKNDFGDVRFTLSDGDTELDYWIDKKVNGNYALFWVVVPNIPEDPVSTSIFIYYGNAIVSTTSRTRIPIPAKAVLPGSPSPTSPGRAPS